MLKRLLSKLKRKKKEYPNRFLKHYHENKKKLLKERKSLYNQKKEAGICVRCNKKALKDIIFCSYHKNMQKGYNKKARSDIQK